jgi:hypothetical protein
MPTNDPHDSEEQRLFEQGLRRFRPVAPPALKILQRRHLPAFTAAAAVLAVMTLTFVQQHSSRTPITIGDVAPRPAPSTQRLTTAQLRVALLASDEDFNRLLDDASPKTLPHSQHGTVLYELGKE